MRNLFVVLLVAACVALPAFATLSTNELETYTFERYVAEFNKSYDSREEYQRRSGVFYANLAEVIAFNKASSRSYFMGINQFSDLTKEEFTAQYNGLRPTYAPPPSPGVAYFSLTDEAPLPDAFDWREAKQPVLTAVKRQGACGSCWAFTAAQSMESMYALQTGELLELSPQQITSCAENTNKCGGTGGCEGGTPQVAWEYIKKVGGITLNSDYPYISGGTKNSAKCILKESMALVVGVSGYTVLPHNDQNAVMRALVTKGPLAVGVDSSNWKPYAGGIFDGCGVNGANITIDHAVQLVGYGTDNKTKQDYWIVRNSWGPNWGEKGYMRLLRKKKDDVCVYNNDWKKYGGGCANDTDVTITACGMCGVLYEVTYPFVEKPKTEGSKVWIAGVVFGVLALVLGILIIFFVCKKYRKTREEVTLEQ